MCGIIGVTGSSAPAEFLLSGLEALEYRGYDSAGIAVVGRDGISRIRAAERAKSIGALSRGLAELPFPTGTGIGHTRWATHGAPTEENAHPHLDCSGRLAIVHNGIIENHRELAAPLRAAGHTFTSVTDTEVVCHLVEEEMAAGRSLTEAVSAVTPRLRGGFALAFVHASEPDTIVATRRSAPLIVGVTDELGVVASDIAALVGTSRRLFALSDDEIARIRPGELTVTRPDGSAVEPRPLEVSWDVAAAQKGGFADFMSKEIHEQPEAITETLLGRIGAGGATELEELSIADETLGGLRRVLLLACGSSYHAALLGRSFIERLARVSAEVEIASEYRYRGAVLEPGTLVVAVSQSGDTADTLAAMAEARRQGALTIALTNVVDSLMSREADGVLYTRAGPEIGVASTKCHLAQIALLQVFALHLARLRGSAPEGALAEHAAALLALPELVAATIAHEEAARAVAGRFAEVEDFYFLGRRLGLPVALEGALKLKELAYVRAEGYPAGEMKHGPISLIEPGVVVVVVATRDDLWEKVMLNVEEMRARGATIVGVCEEGDDETAGLLDAALEVPAAPQMIAPLLGIVPLQFFAHEVATRRGNDVDRPRNLAKVVTVE